MKILILEDDFLYAQSIQEFLENLGFEVEIAEDGEVACRKIASQSYHLFILDIKVPNINGFEVVRYIKNLKITTPIIIATSLTEVKDLVLGYELGCNEYLKKPFDILELKFRIFEILKNHYGILNKESVVINQEYTYNFIQKTLKKGIEEIILAPKEIELLEFLLARKGQYVEMGDIRSEIWGDENLDGTDLRVYIHKIRAKTNPDFILSKRGLGYKINV